MPMPVTHVAGIFVKLIVVHNQMEPDGLKSGNFLSIF